MRPRLPALTLLMWIPVLKNDFVVPCLENLGTTHERPSHNRSGGRHFFYCLSDVAFEEELEVASS